MRPIACAFLAAFLSLLAATAEAAERRRLDLPGGRLGDALVALGRQTGISIGVADVGLADLRVAPVKDALTVEEALTRLLRGKSARAVAVDAATIRIVRRPAVRDRPPAPPRRPPPAPAAVPAPRPPDGPAAEMIITATRRALPLASYPGSAVVLQGDDATLQGLRGTDALIARLPSLTSTHLGPGRNKLFVRGISDSSFTGPTQATVGQYLGETRLNYNAPDPDLRLYDIDRIEVLAGPQGTLYGAGSLGGIVKIVPNAPRLDGDEAAASIGASATAHGEAGADSAVMANWAVADGRLGLRLNAYALSEGGYIDDTLRGLDDVNRVWIAGGRIALRTAPDEYWILDLNVTGQRIRGEDSQFADQGRPPLTRQSPVRQDFGNDYLLGGITGTREWDEFCFVAAAGLVRQRLDERYDTTRIGSPPAAYDLGTEVTLLSAEARLSRGQRGGTGWLVGASLLANRSEQTRDVDLITLRDRRNRVENDIVEGAVYGEGTVRLVPGVTATLGARLSGARLESSGFALRPGFPLPPEPETSARTDTRFLPTAALAARAAPNLLLYARFQQSFRPGGLAIFGDEFNRFRPDRVSALEGGVRYGAPGRGRFDAAAAIAYTSWSDIQADVIDIFAEPTTANIGDARIYTLDLSLGWRPLPGASIEAAAVFNDSRLDNLPPGTSSGDSPPLPGVARFNGRLAAHYALAASDSIDVRMFAAARYTGRSYLGAGDFLRRPQGDWLDVSLGGTLKFGRHNVTLTVTNLLDSAASRFALGSPLTLYQQNHTTPVRPRSIRVVWEARF